MLREFIKYPETAHFKEASSNLYKNKVGEIDIHGTVKLHGTNFSIVFDVTESGWYFQKRTSILEYYSNFFNFQKVFGVGDKESTNKLQAFLNSFVHQLEDKKKLSKVVFFGELIGEEIQRGIVAIQELSKRFVVFDVVKIYKNSEEKDIWINGEELKSLFNNSQQHDNIFCIENFKTWDLKMNVQDIVALKELQNTLQKITEEVEKECPVAKFFGVSGVGEGVVWKHKRFRFKVKGEEHTTSKVRSLKLVDIEKIEQLKTVSEFADAVCTEARLKQGLKYLEENNITENKIKTYINWVIQDTFKEEIDFITEKNLDEKELKKALGTKARIYLNYN